MYFYLTNPEFNKQLFVELLNHIGVKAYAVKNGIVFDYAVFHAVPAGRLPDMLFINKKMMKSRLNVSPLSEKAVEA